MGDKKKRKKRGRALEKLNGESKQCKLLIALFTVYLQVPMQLSLTTPGTIMQVSKHPRPKPPNWSTSSHLVVFIRNLRLLQLDQHEEWPNINLRTLSASSQNQRQRVKAIEWALYHLFSIWDPASTQDVCFRGHVLSLVPDRARNCALSSPLWNLCNR